MTHEAFYGSDYERLKQAQSRLEAIAERLKTAGEPGEDLQPIVYTCSRIKRPESMMKKLESRGLPVTRESALTNVYDAVRQPPRNGKGNKKEADAPQRVRFALLCGLVDPGKSFPKPNIFKSVPSLPAGQLRREKS